MRNIHIFKGVNENVFPFFALIVYFFSPNFFVPLPFPANRMVVPSPDDSIVCAGDLHCGDDQSLLRATQRCLGVFVGGVWICRGSG